jgi:hypothetical protein
VPACRDEATLKAAARDVCYEVNALFRAHARLEDTDEQRLILEALLLHFRNVVDFFFESARGSDGIHASDFFPEPDHWKPPAPAWVPQYRRRCNKLLSHLTYSRIEYGKKREMGWHLDDKLASISGTWNEFLGTLPNYRAAWFK